MNATDTIESLTTMFLAEGGYRNVFCLQSSPGIGKSAVCLEIAKRIAQARHIPEERIITFVSSIRDTTDVLGLPKMNGEYSEWLPPEEFYRIRAGQGPSILILEELMDAPIPMQNALCRIILDRCAGNLKLSEELYILASGNRASDRSGANRLSTKLANRMHLINFDASADDWCRWAARNGIMPELIGFIRYKNDMLNVFDPKRDVNPTPRAWAEVSRVPTSLRPDLYMEHVSACVGEEAAASFVGFLQVFRQLPNLKDFLDHPATVDVPERPDILFAVVAKLASVCTPKNFDKLYKFFERLPTEFCIMAVTDIVTRLDKADEQALTSTMSYRRFMQDNVNALTGTI